MRTIPFPVWRLMFAYALMMGGAALTVLLAGIIGTEFAPSPALATLPIALAVIGVAASTLPTGKLQERFGRRKVFLGYGLLAFISALVAAASLVYESFAGYCLAGFIMGWAAAAGHQYRFAALELVPPEQAARATSVLLLGGILGAFIGPEMAVRGRYLLETEYAGSYLLLAGGYLLGMVIISFYHEKSISHEEDHKDGRGMREILHNPVILLAICTAAMAYGLMSFLMVATPISMHHHAGHSLEATKWVIQSHIAGMYLPSLFFAPLLERLGFKTMLWLGTAFMGVTLAIALAGTAFINYWLSLALLGFGWNFLFLTATNLLTHGHRRSERFRVQSFNDFMTFSVQAVVTLASGWFLYMLGWQGLLWAGVLPLIAFMVLLARSSAFSRLARHYR